MELVIYCSLCEKEHAVSETKDRDGSVIGLFCNTSKAMVPNNVFTTKWAGEDITPVLREYLERCIDRTALKRIKLDRIASLSRKLAFQFMQIDYAKSRGLNYYFVQHHALDIIRRLRCRPEYYTAGE